MFFKKDQGNSSSYQTGYWDGYNAGVKGNSKVYTATFNKDRTYISGYEQGYRKGISEYQNKLGFNSKKDSLQSLNNLHNTNMADVRSRTTAQREINLGSNRFNKW